MADSTLYLMHGSSEMSFPRSEKYQKAETKAPERYVSRSKEDKHKLLYNEKPIERKKYVDDWNEKDRRYSREKFIENFAYEEYDREYRDPPMPRARQNVRQNDWQKKMVRQDSGIERYSDKMSRSTEYLLEDRKRIGLRQRSPSPIDNETPRERFKDAKEKFLLLEKERLEEQERLRKEAPISPTRKERHFISRHARYEKYFDDDDDKPEPAPRSLQHERYQKESSSERYRNDKYDPKRRSMFCLLEEEHKKNSTEIARELKRRSYMENNNYEEDFYRSKKIDGYHPKMPELDQDELKYIQSQKTRAAGYRHSYAEPKLKLEKSKKIFPDVLQRTNSSVSNSGRVGLASIHPY